MATFKIIKPKTASGDLEYALDATNGIDLISLDGLGVPKVTRKMQQANNTGMFDNGYSLGARNMTLVLYTNSSTRALADAARDLIYEITKPNSFAETPFELEVTRDDGGVRRIVCALDNEVKTDYAETRFADHKYVIPLVAANPIWYEPTLRSFTLDLSSSGASTSYTYTGTWDAYPVIKITGQYVDFAFHFSMTEGVDLDDYAIVEKAIGFTGTVADSDQWVLDLRGPYKTFVDHLGANQLGTTVNNLKPNLGLVRLLPSSDITSPYVRATYDTKNGNAEVEFEYYNQYIGI